MAGDTFTTVIFPSKETTDGVTTCSSVWSARVIIADSLSGEEISSFPVCFVLQYSCSTCATSSRSIIFNRKINYFIYKIVDINYFTGE